MEDPQKLLIGVAQMGFGFCYIVLQIISEITSAAFYTTDSAEDYWKAGFYLGATSIILGTAALLVRARPDVRWRRVLETVILLIFLAMLVVYIAMRSLWIVNDPDFTDSFTDCLNWRYPRYYLWNQPPHCAAYSIRIVIAAVTLILACFNVVLCLVELVLLFRTSKLRYQI